jgi:hypothetical protein
MRIRDMLAEFARVGMTAANADQAKARHLPGLSSHVGFSREEVVALLRALPDGAGPLAIRDAFEAEIARRSDPAAD